MDGTELGSVDEVIVRCAEKGMTYKEISLVLKKKNAHMSPNAIGKRLRKCGFLSRKGTTVNTYAEVKARVLTLLPSLPQTVGYRHMTDVLRQQKVHVRRDTVMQIMREVDPLGVEFRRRRRIYRKVYRSFGPNHVWHVDGYDKLKPFGFPIHGCIDGYSRKVLWLTVGPSNNDPAVMGYNFAQCVERLKGCPVILQSDPGTENSVMGALQCRFRHDATDIFGGIRSYRVVRSVFNQRIEAWWSIMRRQQMDWWISFFKDMEAIGLFNKTNPIQLCALRYCFMPLIQKDMDCLVEQWNSHFISNSKRAICPNGRPEVLYLLPEEKGFENCLQPVDQTDIDFAYSQCSTPGISGSTQFDLHSRRFFETQGWTFATSWQEALHQYTSLAQTTDAV